MEPGGLFLMPEIMGKKEGDMHLFYSPFIDSEHLTLDEEETRHCTRVLRLGAGDTVHITDGKGTLLECRILEITGKKCLLETVTVSNASHGKNFHLHIAIAPTKNINRFEWFLEKSTEIGIDEITPVVCEHSERNHLKTFCFKVVPFRVFTHNRGDLINPYFGGFFQEH
jgi:16S rRNA (uracil1498-N3)-methyltransferase